MRRLLPSLVLALLATTALAQRALPVNDPRFHPALIRAAAEYRTWGRVDLIPAWAPELCFMPPPRVVDGTIPRVSAAEAGEHARKVYFLHARDRASYPMHGTWPGSAPPAIGQIVVKEAFAPREVPRGTAGSVEDASGHAFVAGEPIGLYVMALVAAETDPSTDAGWIYGTIDREGRITSSGRVGSCMACHANVPNGGRLFGMRPRLDVRVPSHLVLPP